MFLNSYSAPRPPLLYIIAQLGTSNALRHYSLQTWINKSESWFPPACCDEKRVLPNETIIHSQAESAQCACKKRKFCQSEGIEHHRSLKVVIGSMEVNLCTAAVRTDSSVVPPNESKSLFHLACISCLPLCWVFGLRIYLGWMKGPQNSRNECELCLV